MPVDQGKRRVRPAASKARQEATQEVARATTTSQQKLDGMKEYTDPVEKHEILSDRIFPAGQHPAFVRVAAGGTYNTGPYESLRLDVSVTLPCFPSEVNETFLLASDMVAERLTEEETIWLGSQR